MIYISRYGVCCNTYAVSEVVLKLFWVLKLSWVLMSLADEMR